MLSQSSWANLLGTIVITETAHRRKRNLVFAIGLLLLVAFSIRLALIKILPNDAPQDGLIYDQTARNVVAGHGYSQATEPSYAPSLRRMPGYPLFLAGVYSFFGHNKTAARLIQALMDTATCAMIGMLAYLWEPDERRRQFSSSLALALAAVCPFTAIYTATILTETSAIFLAVAMCLTATLALLATDQRKSLRLWFATGLIAGVAVLFRPDSGLFALAIGLTLVVAGSSQGGGKKLSAQIVYLGAVFSLAFCLVLVPWTVRNYQVFGILQPLSPSYGEMPGEFVPRGYLRWVRTWLDDGRYIGPVIFSLDAAPINLNSIPDRAFDSAGEKLQVGVLLASYNHAGAVNNQTDESSTVNKAAQVKMTPDIDAGFARMAQAKISRSPVRHYLWLPLKRAASLWLILILNTTHFRATCCRSASSITGRKFGCRSLAQLL